jgi:LPS-assembly lipoprotein
MSLFDRRTLLTLPLVLAACGFTPVYAPGGTGAALRGQVAVIAPGDRDSFLLVQELENRFGRGGGRYGLAFDLQVEEEGLAVTRTGDITRFNLVGTVTFTLTDLGNDTLVYEGRVNNFTAFSDTGSTVETLAAERDARARLMRILADQMTAQLFAQADLPAA